MEGDPEVSIRQEHRMHDLVEAPLEYRRMSWDDCIALPDHQ